LHFCFDSVGLDWRKHVKYDERYLRPAEVDSLVGDASKAKRELGWQAAVLAPELADIMTQAEVATLSG
jgi:GDPmannose 4,6-dehydratase